VALDTPTILKVIHVGPIKATASGQDRAYETSYYVETSTRRADPVALRNALRSDFIFTAFASDPAARLSKFDLDQLLTKPKAWRVDAGWSTQQAQQTEEDPLAQPPKRSTTWNYSTKNIDRDIDGKILANTVGDPYDPFEIEDARQEIRIRWNTLFFTSVQADIYKNAINSDTFSGWPPGAVRVAGLNSEEIIIPPAVSSIYPLGLKYYACEAVFVIDTDDLWKLKVWNSGFYLKDPDRPGKRRRIMVEDDNGAPIPCETPQLINEAGTAVIGPDDDPFQQKFDVRKKLPFTSAFPSLV